MNSPIDSVGDHELHAYLDGELDPARRLEVEAWLAANPRAAARVQSYRQIGDSLHARFDAVLAEPVVVPMPVRPAGHKLARAAALAAMVLCSAALGWFLKGQTDVTARSPELAELVQPAAFAHLVYATDSHYPVEIAADRQDSLNRWVSRRMHADLQAPDLAAQGLRLIGGRLLPSTNRMAAQFMYEDERGARLTLYVRRIEDDRGFTDFRYREQDGLHMFYWIDREMGYAVVGELPATRLIAVANSVHRARQASQAPG